jgi:hypothetical protein
MTYLFINKHLLIQVILLKKTKIINLEIFYAQMTAYHYMNKIMKDLNLLEIVYITLAFVIIFLKDIVRRMNVF